MRWNLDGDGYALSESPAAARPVQSPPPSPAPSRREGADERFVEDFKHEWIDWLESVPQTAIHSLPDPVRTWVAELRHYRSSTR